MNKYEVFETMELKRTLYHKMFRGHIMRKDSLENLIVFDIVKAMETRGISA